MVSRQGERMMLKCVPPATLVVTVPAPREAGSSERGSFGHHTWTGAAIGCGRYSRVSAKWRR